MALSGCLVSTSIGCIPTHKSECEDKTCAGCNFGDDPEESDCGQWIENDFAGLGSVVVDELNEKTTTCFKELRHEPAMPCHSSFVVGVWIQI